MPAETLCTFSAKEADVKILHCIICVSCLLVSGCGLSVHEQMVKGLTCLEGSSRDRVFSVLGVPDGRFDIDGRTTAYIWANQKSGTMMIPVNTRSTGVFGQTQFNMNTMSNNNVNYNHACSVKITMQDDIAKMWEYNGNADACYPYASRLSAVIPQ